MRGELGQHLAQGVAMTPAMLHSIEVLQLSTVELLERIEAELGTNETLSIVRPSVDGPRPDRSEARHALLHEVPAPEPDLLSHVRDQLAWLDADAATSEDVLAFVAQLDPLGHVTAPEAELAARFGQERLARIRSLLRRVDPPGLGTRGPIESMIAQLSPGDPDLPAIERLLTDHLEALARHRVPDVAKALGLDADEVEALLERIAVLDPRPGARFHEKPPRPIRPELEVVERDGRIEVVVDDRSIPTLSIDPHYESLAGARDTAREVRRYLREKLTSAGQLLQAVEQRKATLARVGVAVFAEQRPFLRSGPSAIRPLRMADVAERLGIHVSTVSRAVAGKHVLTTHGIHPLRAFFDGRRVAGGHAGRSAVLARVRELIDAEDPAAPLTDDELSSRLRASGLGVPRRTVAKYRQELGLPPFAHRRRR